MRERYAELMAHPERIEETLQDGAAQGARGWPRRSSPNCARRSACAACVAARRAAAPTAQPAPRGRAPVFKQYREADGRFYFKLVGADGARAAAKPRLRRRAATPASGSPG